MKRILFVLGNFYPNITANGICCEKVMQQLKLNGYDVRCLSAAQYNDEWESTQNGIVNYHYKTTLHNILSMKIPHLSFFKRQVLKLITFFTDKIETILGAYNYPLITKKLNRNIYNSLEKIHNEFDFDTVVSVSYPVHGAYSGYKFCKKHPEIELVSYFLDPFVDGRKHKFYSLSQSFEKALKLEKEIVKYSKIVIAQKEHKNHYEKHYPDLINSKIKFLGVPLLEDKTSLNNKKNSSVHAVYAGSLWPEIRNPKYIIEVFKHIPEIIFDIYTPAEKGWIKEYIGEAENIILHDKISYEEIGKVLAEADLLVNISNTISNSSPSKIIEYLGYCKPIISASGNSNDSCNEILNSYELGLSLNEQDCDWEVIRKDALALLSNKKSVSYEQIKQNFWSCTPDSVIQLLIENF